GDGMEISDIIYGQHHIDGVLEELIKSAPVQRLKGIYQGGASFLVNRKWNVTRYEHSIGVMLLIKKLGGTIEEQIAGLLHDVSHTAFSHVVDVVFENQAEDYH
ncbi:HD domain-containing protein, partial [Enterococcus faecalis]|uniref:HD domain-containing protein n=1 Tax=Enterococcus faecalis TaxID=1351 RepID=UPI003984F9C6